MVVARYLLPENQTPRRKHHEEMVKRLISSPRSRCAANTYIYRCQTDERERIVGILNQWDNNSYSTQTTGQVINKEAVGDIKEWCSNSSGKDLAVVKKFLQHLTNEQVKNNEEEAEEPSGSGTNRSSARSRKPSFTRGNSLPLTNRPGFSRSESLTNGSFYEGRGNRSGMFQVVHALPQPEYKKRPVTSSATAVKINKPAPVARQSTQPAMMRKEPAFFEIPANRSSMFGEVIRPPPQKQDQPRPLSNTRPQSNARPSTNQFNARPSTNQFNTSQGQGKWERSATISVGRPSSKIPVKEGGNRPYTQNRYRPSTQGSQRSQDSQKLKYSANLHDAKDDEIRENGGGEFERQDHQAISPLKYNHRQSSAMSHKNFQRIDVNRSPVYYEQQQSYDYEDEGSYSYRQEGISERRAPARRWQPSQIF